MNKSDLALYQELLAEQKSRMVQMANSAKYILLSKEDSYKYLKIPQPKSLPEPEFSLEEIEAAEKIINDLA